MHYLDPSIEIHKGVKSVHANSSDMIIAVHRYISPSTDVVQKPSNHKLEHGIHWIKYDSLSSDLISTLGQGYHIKFAMVGKQTKAPPKYELIIFPSYCRCGASRKWLMVFASIRHKLMQLPMSSFLLCDHSNRMTISSVLAPVSRENMTMEIM